MGTLWLEFKNELLSLIVKKKRGVSITNTLGQYNENTGNYDMYQIEYKHRWISSEVKEDKEYFCFKIETALSPFDVELYLCSILFLC